MEPEDVKVRHTAHFEFTRYSLTFWQTVLATKFPDFYKGPLLLDMWTDLLGTGVFNADGGSQSPHHVAQKD